MKSLLAGIAIVAATFGLATPALADPASTQTASSTTLDACGYFVGVQTTRSTSTDANGVTTQHGTWTGVANNYVMTPVASLGAVQGAFVETTQTESDGTVVGTESFVSNAGKIDQYFSYGPSVPGGFDVAVTATRDLSFLTSNTNGDCYSGPFPRP